MASISVFRGLALALVCVVLTACAAGAPSASLSPAESVATAMPTPSPSPTATATPSPVSAGPSSSGSATLAWAEAEFDGRVDGIVAFRGEYVAVGTHDRVPTAWTSSDGETWQPHAVPYSPPSGDASGMPGPWMGNLVEHGGWLFAIGGYQGGGDAIVPLGWRSPDGRTWEQIVSQNPFYTKGYLVWGLVSADDGLLALTHGFGDMTGGVWLWTAADSWIEMTDALPGTSGGAEFYDASWADGRFVVVGHGSGGGARDASIWTSKDGRTWQMNDVPYPWRSNGDELAVVTAVAPAPGGGWSAFLKAPGRAVGLYSTDARSWEVTQDLMGISSGYIGAIANVGDRLIAVGGPDGESAGAWVATSSDGRAWEKSQGIDDAGHSWFYSRGGPSIASNGSSVLVVLPLPEPESWRGSVLLLGRLP